MSASKYGDRSGLHTSPRQCQQEAGYRDAQGRRVGVPNKVQIGDDYSLQPSARLSGPGGKGISPYAKKQPS